MNKCMVKKLYSNYTKLYSNISIIIILYISTKFYSNSKRYIVKYEISNSSCSITVAYSYYIYVFPFCLLCSVFGSTNIIRFLNFCNFYLSIVLQNFCYLHNFA